MVPVWEMAADFSDSMIAPMKVKTFYEAFPLVLQIVTSQI
jgi:hypothetical protein